MTQWFRIDELCGCRIEGLDAVGFCQSQLTADIDLLTDERWQQTAWCNRKGRVRALILAKKNQQDVELILPASQAGMLKELGRFTIGRKVNIGSTERVAGSTARDQHGVIDSDRFERAVRLQTKDQGEAVEPDRDWLNRWAVQDLLMPLPWLSESTQDRFLPQALGLENNGGLSYAKGCYPGQEVVARVHYLGRPPERLTGLTIKSSEPLSGSALRGAEAQTSGGQRVSLLSAAKHRDCWLALAVVPDKTSDGDTVELTLDGIRLQAKMTPLESLC